MQAVQAGVVTYHLNIQLTPTFSDLLQHSPTFSNILILLLFYFAKSNSDHLVPAFWTSSILILLHLLRGYCFQLHCVLYITNSTTMLLLNFLPPLSSSD